MTTTSAWGGAVQRRAMTSTERSQSARRRKQDRLTLVKIEMLEEEIDALVQRGLLRAAERGDAAAIAGSLYDLLPAAFQALADGTLRLKALA
jgi:hypothetical protein